MAVKTVQSFRFADANDLAQEILTLQWSQYVLVESRVAPGQTLTHATLVETKLTDGSAVHTLILS